MLTSILSLVCQLAKVSVTEGNYLATTTYKRKMYTAGIQRCTKDLFVIALTASRLPRLLIVCLEVLSDCKQSFKYFSDIEKYNANWKWTTFVFKVKAEPFEMCWLQWGSVVELMASIWRQLGIFQLLATKAITICCWCSTLFVNIFSPETLWPSAQPTVSECLQTRWCLLCK